VPNGGKAALDRATLFQLLGYVAYDHHGARRSRALPFYQARRPWPTACTVPGDLAATAQRALEELVERAASADDVWLAPLGDIATHVRTLGLAPRALERPELPDAPP